MFFVFLATANIAHVITNLFMPHLLVKWTEYKGPDKKAMNPVMVHGLITLKLAYRIVRELKALENDTTVSTICIILDSDGGLYAADTAIRMAMEKCQKPIEIKCKGARSAAVDILASGTPKKRFLYNNGKKIVIHNGQSLGGEWPGSRLLVGSMICNRQIAKLISNKTGQSLKRVRQDMKNKTWFGAQEAVEYGLADDVLTQR
ncbi:ATP-dependent Clp protease proteolytic subunit [Patescibacteria group bacterium AH-259-L07]|nr:ATP-dependent Clp protease proteolytic subunit [Patescibacteria group bacterium AH-259-L07]